MVPAESFPPPAGRVIDRPVLRRAWAWLVLLALVAIGVTAVHKQLRDGNDFPIYWQAARDLIAGRSPYHVGAGLHGYVYLPWFACLLVPLAVLPLPVAAAAWYLANLAFTALAARALLGAMQEAGLTVRPGTLALATLPLAALFHDNLVLGQANLMLLWLVAASVRGAMPGRDTWLRVPALGLAAALKMPAGVLIVPLALRGRMRAVIGLLVGAALALAAPFLPTGPDVGVTLLRDWRAQVLAPAAAGTLQGSKVIDQSPQAALRRLLVAEAAYEGHAVSVATLDPPAFAMVSRATSAAIFAAYLLVWLLAPGPRRLAVGDPAAPRALLIDLALGCCATLQLIGFALKAQFVVLLLPAWLAATLAGESRARGPRVLLGAAGALFLVSQPGLVGRAAANVFLAYSAMTAGVFLLAAVLARFRFSALTPLPSGAPAAARGPGTVR